MKNVQKIVMVIILITGTMLASGQSNTDIKQILSKPETRKTIMDAIANDSIMSKEMMTTMMNSPHHQMMMKDHGSMMKDNPGMKHCMMYQMMDSCKGDTAMMSAKCKAMMKAWKSDTTMMKCKAMMESCKSDTSMMKCKTMMENQDGKEMMHKKMIENEAAKNIEGVDKTKLEVIKPKK